MRHVLVTGGGSGIGAATVQACAAAGARVSVFDRAGVDLGWGSVPSGLQGVWAEGDVRDVEALRKAVADIGGELDGLVTCAGVVAKPPLLDATVAEWQRTLEVNVLGTAMAVQIVAQALVEQQRPGAVVTVSSIAAFGHAAGLGPAYHASKGAIVAMTRALAGELAVHEIRVNGVAPGLVRTPMTAVEREQVGERDLAARSPQARILDPEDVAGVIAFLLSDASGGVTGQVLPVDAGQEAVVGAPSAGYPVPGSLRIPAAPES